MTLRTRLLFAVVLALLVAACLTCLASCRRSCGAKIADEPASERDEPRADERAGSADDRAGDPASERAGDPASERAGDPASERAGEAPGATGVAISIGGANQWSCYGGSRLILADGRSGSYAHLDCTKPVELKLRMDASGLECGFVFAVYSVAMEAVPGASDLGGTLYNDAQGIGFHTASGDGINASKARTELDFVETTGRSAQLALHGFATGETDRSQNAERWLDNGQGDAVDQDGVYDNANQNRTPLKVGNTKLGDKSPIIDTSKPFALHSTLTPTPVGDGTHCTIRIVSVLSQEGRTVTMTVDSKANHTVFPVAELRKQALFISLWTDVNGTAWLDGSPRADDVRGPCTEREYRIGARLQQHVDAGDVNVCGGDKTYTAVFSDVAFKVGGEANRTDGYGWVLDYGYRGINAAGGPSEYSPTNAQMWSGRYDYSYAVCRVPADLPAPPPRVLGPLDQDDMLDACKKLYGARASKPIAKEDQWKSCAHDGTDACQLLDTTLARF